MDWKIELLAVPVTDIDRSKAFYESLGFVTDIDTTVDEKIRFVRWIDMQHGRRSTTQDEHLRITAHLRAREAEAAAVLMQAHIGRRLDQIAEVIRAGFSEIYAGNSLADRLLGELA